MPIPEVYIGHASSVNDAICRELVAALRGAGVPQLHYEQFAPETGEMTVVVVGELHSRPVNLFLLSAEELRSSILREFAEVEHKRVQNEPLRILLPVVVGPIAEEDIWPFLRGYPRVESAPGKPYPQAEAIRHTLKTIALATPPSGLMRLFGGAFTPNPLVHAKALYWKGNDVQALDALQQVTNEQPQSFDAWYALAALLDKKGQAQAALAAYDRALAINSMVSEVLVKKAFLLNALGQRDAALVACNMALAFDIRSSNALNVKGYILDDLNQLDEALGAYERALELEPDMLTGWSNMGITLRKLQRLDEAKVAQERAITLDASFAPAHINLANVLLDMNQGEDALAEADRAIALDATNPVFWYTRGRALTSLRRYPEALSALQRCPNLAPARALRAEVERVMRN